MFIRYFLIVLLTFAIPFGYAQDNRWELVAISINDDIFYVDKLTIQKVGSEVTFWQKVD